MRNFIGVDLGGTNIRAAIVSEDGTIKCMKKSESHPERGAEAVMETMISLIESLDGYEECEGIGMGIPGPIDTINGKIIVSTDCIARPNAISPITPVNPIRTTKMI